MHTHTLALRNFGSPMYRVCRADKVPSRGLFALLAATATRVYFGRVCFVCKFAAGIYEALIKDSSGPRNVGSVRGKLRESRKSYGAANRGDFVMRAAFSRASSSFFLGGAMTLQFCRFLECLCFNAPRPVGLHMGGGN